MKPTRPLSDAGRFFFEHAGLSYDPATETPEEGRTRGAEKLADAELIYLLAHQWAGVRCEWAPESKPDLSWLKRGQTVDTCEMCAIVHCDESGTRRYLASLGNITDATPEYRRAVRAELALECLESLSELIQKAKP